MRNSTVTDRPSTRTMSTADVKAHEAASYVRPFLSPAGVEALRRLEADTARIRRDQVDAARTELTLQGLAEYEAWAGGAA